MGGILFFWALRAHGRRPLSAAFSPDEPAHLVDWGPYRFIRHPFYSAYLLTWLAGFVATARFALIPTIVVMFWIYWRAADLEEKKFAASPLAENYRRYSQLTGRFLPAPLGWLRRRKEADAASLA
jgi:protein-S-isoprenylcysteine O-methyltransferase Ste14